MYKKILIAVSAAAVIGLLGVAPHAYADNVDQQERAAGKSDQGGQVPWWWNEGARGSFAYQPPETVKHVKHKK
jgi:hypothetical protein